jgi:hypothetical protein
VFEYDPQAPLDMEDLSPLQDRRICIEATDKPNTCGLEICTPSVSSLSGRDSVRVVEWVCRFLYAGLLSTINPGLISRRGTRWMR